MKIFNLKRYICFSLFFAACFQNASAGSEPIQTGDKITRGFSSASEWRFVLDQGKSRISFLLKGNTHDTKGSVTKMQCSISMLVSPDGLFSVPDVQIVINPDDIDTKNGIRNRRMKKTFLEIDKFPEIIFRATEIKKKQGQPEVYANLKATTPFPFDLGGELTLHGKTKKISLKINASFLDDRLIADGETTLDLRDFAIKNPSLLFFRVANEVLIQFHVEAVRNF